MLITFDYPQRCSQPYTTYVIFSHTLQRLRRSAGGDRPRNDVEEYADKVITFFGG